MEIIRFSGDQEIPSDYLKQLNQRFDLWMNREDCDEVFQYEHLYLAVSNDLVIGFQSVNDCVECLAIEILPEFREKGISIALVDESGATTPHPLGNDNPNFWARVAAIYAD